MGRRGEALAAAHLEARGYDILSRNWRVRRYELDLVAVRGSIVAFVEVKTRSDGPQRPAEALTRAQRRRIRRAAEAWIHAHPGVGSEFRFDLVAVRIGGSGRARVRHIEGAFYGEDAG